MEKSVLVCHSNLNALSIIQEYSKKGLDVYLIDHICGIAGKSKYLKAFYRVYDPQKDDMKTAEDIISIVKRLKVRPLIVPTSDHWVTALARHKEKLEKYASVLTADYDVVDKVINKRQFYEWAGKMGYSIPRTFVMDELDDLKDNYFPVVAKFEFRRKSSSKNEIQPPREVVNKLRLQFLQSKKELAEYVKKNSDFLKYIVFQEMIPGMSNNMHTVGIYADRNHEIKGLFSGQKIRGFPADVGDCMVGEVKSCPKYVIEEAKKIVRELKYTGIAEIEYKISEKDGRYRLIEINPRTWSWVGITQFCNVSLPMIAYRNLILGEELEYEDSLSVRDGSVRFIRIYDDLYNNLVGYSKDVAMKVSLGKWLLEFKGRKNYILEFTEFKVLKTCMIAFAIKILRYLKKAVIK